MKAAILEKDERLYTFLKEIFNAINNEQLNYNWLITDIEACPRSKKAELFYNERVWITGEELTKIINEDDFQWIWGVLTGFDKKISFEDAIKNTIPYADGNPNFWNENLDIQNRLGEIEIVAWDSSLTIIISKKDRIIDDFMKYFPNSEDLFFKNYNRTMINTLKNILTNRDLLIEKMFNSDLNKVTSEDLREGYTLFEIYSIKKSDSISIENVFASLIKESIFYSQSWDDEVNSEYNLSFHKNLKETWLPQYLPNSFEEILLLNNRNIKKYLVNSLEDFAKLRSEKVKSKIKDLIYLIHNSIGCFLIEELYPIYSNDSAIIETKDKFIYISFGYYD